MRLGGERDRRPRSAETRNPDLRGQANVSIGLDNNNLQTALQAVASGRSTLELVVRVAAGPGCTQRRGIEPLRVLDEVEDGK